MRLKAIRYEIMKLEAASGSASDPERRTVVTLASTERSVYNALAALRRAYRASRGSGCAYFIRPVYECISHDRS